MKMMQESTFYAIV